MEKLGGMGGIMGMLPGMGKIKDQLASANLDNKVFKRQRAIILSMTAAERRDPDLLKASRKKRIAAGSGTKVEEINKLLKMYWGIADMMKAARQGKGGMMGRLGAMLGMGGGMGGMPQPTPEQMEALQKQMGGGAMPPGMPNIPAAPPPGLFGSKPGLPGLGGPKLPGLGGGPPGFPFGGKKK
jgi:signal recognition particle subunit SRP54